MSMKLLHISRDFKSLTLISPLLPSFTTKPLCFRPSWKTAFPANLGRRAAVSASAQNGDSNRSSNPSPSNHEDHLSLAQESIAGFLHQEIGLSVDDSEFISTNSPKYARMIVEGVMDLEEWNSWKGDGDGEGIEGLGFKEKVVYMVQQKGDGGKVAFLESLGLSLSSAMGLARYLSSESLPVLLDKVKYLKEIFFSDSDDKVPVGKYARRMMMYLSIPIDEDVQQTLSFFEKIEARRGGLEMLGFVDGSFRFLIESFPHLFLLSVESHMKPTVEFLESTGIPRDSLGKVLLLFPPIMFYKTEEIRRKVAAAALEKDGAMNKDTGKMLLKYPWVLSTSIQENYQRIISLFEGERVPKVDIDRAIRRWPLLLGCSKSNMKLIMDEFSELGVRNKKVGKIVSTSPQLLLRKPEDFLQVVSFLEDLGFDKETVGKILCRCPEIFASSIEKTLQRKLNFLTRFGVSKTHFPRVIRKYPELLVSDTDRTILPRVKYLLEIGLSEKEIAFMVRKFSPLLGYGIDEVLRPKLEFLVNSMEKPVTEVVDYPRYFSYSLEKRIKPRFWVLKGKNVECTLEEMLGKNDEEFAAEFMGVESV